MNFIFKNKKKLFSDNISNMCSFDVFSLLFYLINLISIFISIIVYLNKNIILINKFKKHN
jgi:hypothetical protein